VKLSGNFLIGSVIESLGEAIALTRKSGVDPQKFVAMLTTSLFAAPVYKTYGDLIVSGRYRPTGFKVTLALKDVGLVLDAARAAVVPLPFGSLIRDHLLAAVAQDDRKH
jgi:3-hydroxyisobutyrate dehydrogenase-like beta-hydroxyacid dehydrogenase